MATSSTSHFFDFRLNKNFFRDINKNYAFDVDGLTGSDGGDEYLIKVYSSVPADINNCVDEYGCVLESVNGLTETQSSETDHTIHLLYTDTENNYGFTITVAEANGVTLSIPDDASIQGIFIINKATGYLFAYARLSNPIELSGNIILPFTGALCKVGNCQ